MSELCPRCGSTTLTKSDMTGLTYLWTDETPFDPQPEEWACTAQDCRHIELRGLTPEQLGRLTGGFDAILNQPTKAVYPAPPERTVR